MDIDRGDAADPGTPSAPCSIEVIPDGPLLVRGAAEVVDVNGRAHPVDRPVAAVCTCGFTQRSPWCDGTHKVARPG